MAYREEERVMTERIKKLYDIVRKPEIQISITKATLFTEGFRKYEGEPDIIRMAHAQAYMMERIPIFILPGDLIAGAPASKPMAVEADFWTKGTWQKEGIESLRNEEYSITDEEIDKMYELTDYWHKIIPEYKVYDLYDEEMWNWKRSGFLLPVNKTLEEAAGMGYACNGMAILPESDSYQIDHAYVIATGLEKKIQEAKDELAKMTSMSIKTEEDMEKVYVLRAMIIIDEATIRWAARYADLAEQQAAECQDETRKKELLYMAESCRRVPAKPAENFRDAFQFIYFLFLMCACQTTTPLGRLDQVLYPYYKKDIEAGILDDNTVLEYMQCYRCKIMQMKNTSGGQTRLKMSGQARWNGVTIGGVDKDGNDVTNELSYLFLEAAYRCRLPHHTLHLRVHEGTPLKLMMKALELVKTGIGMPAFNSDPCYIKNLMDKGVPLEVARNYMIMGCVDPTVPEGFGHVCSMVVSSLPLDTCLHKGYSKQIGMQCTPECKDVRECKTFDEFFDLLQSQVYFYYSYFAQDMQLRYLTYRRVMQDPFPVSVFSDGAKVGKAGKMRPMPYKLGPSLNVGVGAINVCDSVAVIKKLIYDEKKLTWDELLNAMDNNWDGVEGQRIREMCLAVPKYGNDDPYTDEIAAMVYGMLADTATSLDSYRGVKFTATGLSITSHDPGGRITGATPDGRYAGTPLADGAASPVQGADHCGPTAMLNSAMKIPQYKMQAMLHNMKIHPSALKTEEDMMKLAMMIKTYMLEGGKQIQFNVVNQGEMLDAMDHPEMHKDLIVRVAGYSAYFIQLGKNVQSEIVARTSYQAL